MPVWLLILSSGVTVAAFMGAAGLWIVRAVVAKDVRPLSDSMTGLTGELRALTSTMTETKMDGKEHERELRAILSDLTKLVAALDKRVAVAEEQLKQVGEPKPVRRRS